MGMTARDIINGAIVDEGMKVALRKLLNAGAFSNGTGVVSNGVPEATVTAEERGNMVMHQTVLRLTATPLTVTDDAGVAQYGGVKIFTFPLGFIQLHGAMVSGNLTLGTTGTIIAAYTGVNALGSITATTGATLVSTEATWLQSTANATASAAVAAIQSVSIATQVTESGGRWYDGTVTAGPVFLNFAIADDATHTTGTGSFTGTIILTWTLLGAL